MDTGRKSGKFILRKTTVRDIKFEDFTNPSKFSYLMMGDRKSLLMWLMVKQIIADNVHCNISESDCSLDAGKNKIDGFSWRCRRNRNH